MNDSVPGHPFSILVDLNSEVNLLDLSTVLGEGLPLSKTDSITDVRIDNAGEVVALPSTRYGLSQFVVRGAILSIYGETGQVYWEGKGMGPTPVTVHFRRVDLNRLSRAAM